MTSSMFPKLCQLSSPTFLYRSPPKLGQKIIFNISLSHIVVARLQFHSILHRIQSMLFVCLFMWYLPFHIRVHCYWSACLSGWTNANPCTASVLFTIFNDFYYYYHGWLWAGLGKAWLGFGFTWYFCCFGRWGLTFLGGLLLLLFEYYCKCW